MAQHYLGGEKQKKKKEKNQLFMEMESGSETVRAAYGFQNFLHTIFD